MADKRHADELDIDEPLVRALLRDQAPQWADLPMSEIVDGGTDHTIFRLGDELLVRLPCQVYKQQQVVDEMTTVPRLAPHLPLELPVTLHLGEPGHGYPCPWSVVRWIPGERLTTENVDLPQAADDLAAFVVALQACDTTGGRAAGQQTGLRGLDLDVWVDIIAEYLPKYDDIDVTDALAAWEETLAAPRWDRPPVWFHGDLSGNLIVRDRRIVGVIDSAYGVGDPACDLESGWTIFRGADRERFFDAVGADDAIRLRARGWALAPALIGLGYYRDVPRLRANAIGAIEGALSD
ncbi:MAG TPA: aminoglycoside phosphotransferase family protein [Acidimicrobiales bacterium]|nr:aminoglycoside phosphotransferase family protein [Acidimicrobiales bacterium]